MLAGPPGWGQQPQPTPHRRILDYLPDTLLRRVVASARALVLPSTYEGFGLPLLEGLASGVPVVASDLPVHREVAGPHADYVGVNDVDGLAEALARVQAAPRDEPAMTARRNWARQWTWAACITATQSAYRAARGVT